MLFQFHEYLHQNMVCVLLIDWRDGAAATSSNFYAQAAANTITVGRQAGLLFYQLVASRQISPSDIHIIGFSLGAHVAHFASKWYRQLILNTNTRRHDPRQLSPPTVRGSANPVLGSALTGASFGRITGLDPAARHFQGYENAFLIRGDASFVDVIHSSIVYHSGNFLDVLNSRYGIPDPTGDVDFYPNGGDAPQPGCSGTTTSCSHNRAIDYFIDSLNVSISRESRIAVPCDDYEHFDECYNSLNHLLTSISSMRRQATSATTAMMMRGNVSCMGIESLMFAGRGKMFLQYTPTHTGYYVSY
jgi:hypothetical protein